MSTTATKPNLATAPVPESALHMDRWLERDLLPDWLIRAGIRRLLKQRLREEDAGDVEKQCTRLLAFVAQLEASPVAIATDAANQQHYEVPARFFELALGKHMKYSSGLWL